INVPEIPSKPPSRSKPNPEYNHPTTDYIPSHDENNPRISDSNERSKSNYNLQGESQTKLKTSTEDIATYLIDQMGNKAVDVFKQEVVDWAKEKGYSDKEAEELGENAENLAKCMKNFALSLGKWVFNISSDTSCISCEQINSLSSVHTKSSQINVTAAIATLKLLHSLKVTIDDTGKCKYNLACMNTYANDNSCLQSLSSGNNFSAKKFACNILFI
ncbi:1978_t:CDS:2, partial [Racocetra persica]